MTEFNRNELKTKTMAEFSPPKPVVKPEKPAKPPEPAPADDFYEEDEPSLIGRLKFIFPVIIIAIICFVTYSWYSDKFAISNAGGDLPVIMASKEPLREKPEDPGGMKIINRDKRVYDAISGKDEDRVANVLPAPEEPISHDKIIQGKIEQNNQEGSNIKGEDVTEVEDNSQIPAAKAEPEKIVAAANDVPVPMPEKEKIVKEEVKTPKAVTTADIIEVSPQKHVAPQKKNAKNNSSYSGYRVQLGSYRSSGDATASLKSMKKKWPDIIFEANDYIEKIDLGEKGIFYRLQLAGFKSEADARKICQKLTEKKQGCFFVGK